VNSVPHQQFEELALRIPHGLHVGLRVEFPSLCQSPRAAEHPARFWGPPLQSIS